MYIYLYICEGGEGSRAQTSPSFVAKNASAVGVSAGGGVRGWGGGSGVARIGSTVECMVRHALRNSRDMCVPRASSHQY